MKSYAAVLDLRSRTLLTNVSFILQLPMIEIKQSATFRKWFSKLKDKRARALIAIRFQRLEEGNAGDVAPVGDGIGELRIHQGSGYRVYFQRRGAFIVLLLCGGDKSTQDRDIRTATKLAADWSDDNG